MQTRALFKPPLSIGHMKEPSNKGVSLGFYPVLWSQEGGHLHWDLGLRLWYVECVIWRVHPVETRRGDDGRQWSGTKWGDGNWTGLWKSRAPGDLPKPVSMAHFSLPGSVLHTQLPPVHLYLDALEALQPSHLPPHQHFTYYSFRCMTPPFFPFTFTSRPLDATSLLLPHPLLCATCFCLNSDVFYLSKLLSQSLTCYLRP